MVTGSVSIVVTGSVHTHGHRKRRYGHRKLTYGLRMHYYGHDSCAPCGLSYIPSQMVGELHFIILFDIEKM